MRAIILKARKLGFSTFAQGLLAAAHDAQAAAPGDHRRPRHHHRRRDRADGRADVRQPARLAGPRAAAQAADRQPPAPQGDPLRHAGRLHEVQHAGDARRPELTAGRHRAVLRGRPRSHLPLDPRLRGRLLGRPATQADRAAQRRPVRRPRHARALRVHGQRPQRVQDAVGSGPGRPLRLLSLLRCLASGRPLPTQVRLQASGTAVHLRPRVGLLRRRRGGADARATTSTPSSSTGGGGRSRTSPRATSTSSARSTRPSPRKPSSPPARRCSARS